MAVTQTPEKNKAVVRMLYEDCFNTGKLDALDQLIAEDFVGVNGRKGSAAFAEIIQGLRQGFPDIQWSVEDLVAEGDKVAIRWTWQGTHNDTFRGFPATQKSVSDHAIAIYQFKDDKIVHAWIETDRLGFLQQIGVIPQEVGTAQQPQK